MTKTPAIKGFSKLSKKQKLIKITQLFPEPDEATRLLESFWHLNPEIQKLFDEFSENTISNFYFPYGVAPNFLINGKTYIVPMVIEESSVVAAAANSARFWIDKGGFKSEVISVEKVGQVHFIWEGNPDILHREFQSIRQKLIDQTHHLTSNMQKRGGGILDIQLRDERNKIPGYYNLLATFDTRDAMGANFINSCLEEFAMVLKQVFSDEEIFGKEPYNVIMSILSNFTPGCLVKTSVECPVSDLKGADDSLSPEEFAWKFEKAVIIAQKDIYRAATHNKGIFNGIDAVAMATGNDFRAIEACGHAYAARNGKYTSLTEVSLANDRFHYSLTMPIAIGTVGGLTSLHPLASFSLKLLGNPTAEELMMIATSVGLANNFTAIKSLITKGIQTGHMKMHLLNILNSLGACEAEKTDAVEFFKSHKVSFKSVADFLTHHRNS